MRWKSGSAAGSASIASLGAAAALGVLSAYAFVDLANFRVRGEPTECPVRLGQRFAELGTLWVHEVTETSFAVVNTSASPVELVSRASDCATYAPFARTSSGGEMAFGGRQVAVLEPGASCEIGVRFTVRRIGAERFTLDCLAVSGQSSWPLRFTAEVRGQAGIEVTPQALHLSASRPLGTFEVRLTDASAFAPAPSSDPAALVFASPRDGSCNVWSIGVMATSHGASGNLAMPLEVWTANGRHLRLKIPVTLGS